VAQEKGLNVLINGILSVFQKIFSPIYNKSIVLQKIDWLIYINILLIIFVSSYSQSDNIGYFAIIIIFLTFIKLLTKTGTRFEMTTGDKFLLLYFIVVLISVAGSTLLPLSLKGFSKTLIYLGFYVSFIHYIKDNKSKIKYILLLLGLVTVGESLIALKQNFLSVSEISGWQDTTRLNPEEVMTRVYGTLKPYNPNLFGGYILGALPSTLIFAYLPILNKHYKTGLIGLLLFFLSATAIILTGCRGAYIGLFFELILLAVFTYHFLKNKFRRIFIELSAIIFGLVSAAVVSTSSLRARIFSIFAMRSDSSNSFRFNVYNSCLDMFKDNWLLGIGVGNQNFREIYGLYMRTGFDALSAYNIYLETAVESGLFALLFFIAFLYSNLSKSIKYIFNHKNPRIIYLTIATVSIIGLLVHGCVDTVFFRPQIQVVFWTMIGIIRILTK
jgi:putative inorganic carbon (HCO3(-)) transporter